LGGIAAVSDIVIEAESVRFAFAGDLQAQHDLLKHLIGEGFPVAEFAPVAGNLQESYLALMRGEVRR
jgi:hypothetical protein